MVGANDTSSWPALFGLRRQAGDEFGRIWSFAYRPVQEREFAGVWHTSPADATDRLLRHDEIYPNNLASVKYSKRDGKEIVERASVAHRPDGFLGAWQTHLRLFPHPDGTALYVHHERNALRAPVKHVNGIGWDAQAGVEKTHGILESLGADYTPPASARND